MRFEVIGCSVGAPVDGPASGYVVATDTTTVLLDCGSGVCGHVWQRDLDAIVVSHMHQDHCLDLLPLSTSVVAELVGPRRPRLIVPRANGRAVLDALATAIGDDPARWDKAFAVEDYAAEDTVVVGDLTFSFAANDHVGPTHAIRVTDGGRTVVYSADTRPTSQLRDLARDADLAVFESTFAAEEDDAAAYGHMTAGQAGAIARDAAARRLVLTHLVPAEDGNAQLLELGRAAFGSDAVELARAGLVIEL